MGSKMTGIRLFIRFIPAVADPAVPLGDSDRHIVNTKASVPDIIPNKRYKIINVV